MQFQGKEIMKQRGCGDILRSGAVYQMLWNVMCPSRSHCVYLGLPPPFLAFATPGRRFAAEKKRKSATIAADRRKHPALAFVCLLSQDELSVWVCDCVCGSVTLWRLLPPRQRACECVGELGFDIICAASWQIFVTAALNWILTFLCMQIEIGVPSPVPMSLVHPRVLQGKGTNHRSSPG